MGRLDLRTLDGWRVGRLPGVAQAGDGGPVSPYDPSAAALFSRFSSDPGEERKLLISSMFTTGKAKSFWAKLDALWVHAAHAPEAGRLNWLGDTFNCLPVNNPAFVVDRGYRGDGSTSYLDTQFNPATAANPKYTRDSASFGVRCVEAVVANSGSLAGFYDGAKGLTLNPRSTGNAYTLRVNQAPFINGAGVASTLAMYAAVRNGPEDVKLYREGVQVLSDVSPSSPVADGTFRIGAISDSSLRACRFCMGWIGGGLTAQEVADIYAWFQPYRTAVGIP